MASFRLFRKPPIEQQSLLFSLSRELLLSIFAYITCPDATKLQYEPTAGEGQLYFYGRGAASVQVLRTCQQAFDVGIEAMIIHHQLLHLEYSGPDELSPLLTCVEVRPDYPSLTLRRGLLSSSCCVALSVSVEKGFHPRLRPDRLSYPRRFQYLYVSVGHILPWLQSLQGQASMAIPQHPDRLGTLSTQVVWDITACIVHNVGERRGAAIVLDTVRAAIEPMALWAPRSTTTIKHPAYAILEPSSGGNDLAVWLKHVIGVHTFRLNRANRLRLYDNLVRQGIVTEHRQLCVNLARLIRVLCSDDYETELYNGFSVQLHMLLVAAAISYCSFWYGDGEQATPTDWLDRKACRGDVCPCQIFESTLLKEALYQPHPPSWLPCPDVAWHALSHRFHLCHYVSGVPDNLLDLRRVSTHLRHAYRTHCAQFATAVYGSNSQKGHNANEDRKWMAHVLVRLDHDSRLLDEPDMSIFRSSEDPDLPLSHGVIERCSLRILDEEYADFDGKARISLARLADDIQGADVFL